MTGVVVDVIRSILFIRKFDNEPVSDPVLNGFHYE